MSKFRFVLKLFLVKFYVLNLDSQACVWPLYCMYFRTQNGNSFMYGKSEFTPSDGSCITIKSYWKRASLLCRYHELSWSLFRRIPVLRTLPTHYSFWTVKKRFENSSIKAYQRFLCIISNEIQSRDSYNIEKKKSRTGLGSVGMPHPFDRSRDALAARGGLLTNSRFTKWRCFCWNLSSSEFGSDVLTVNPENFTWYTSENNTHTMRGIPLMHTPQNESTKLQKQG